MGEKWLNENIELNQKIIVAHIRESVVEHKTKIISDIRNPDFNEWLKLFKMITTSLNVVILRIGLINLTPINMKGVIDLTQRKISFLQEIALIGNADLFLGCESGPNVMAGALKTRSVLGSYVNHLCIPQMSLQNQIVLYKTLYDKEGKVLDIKNLYHFNKITNFDSFLIYDTKRLLNKIKPLLFFEKLNATQTKMIDSENNLKITQKILSYKDTPIEEIYEAVKKSLS